MAYRQAETARGEGGATSDRGLVTGDAYLCSVRPRARKKQTHHESSFGATRMLLSLRVCPVSLQTPTLMLITSTAPRRGGLLSDSRRRRSFY